MSRHDLQRTSPIKHNHGFTLIEMMVAIALSGLLCALAMNLWFGTNLDVMQTHKRNLEKLGIQTSTMALDARIRKAVSFYELRNDQLIWVEQNGALDTLRFERDSVWLNGQPAISAPVNSFALHADGPSWNKDSTTQNEAWSKLDVDRNGHLDEDELDADYSHSLDAHELSHAALIELKLGFVDGSVVTLDWAIRAK